MARQSRAPTSTRTPLGTGSALLAVFAGEDRNSIFKQTFDRILTRLAPLPPSKRKTLVAWCRDSIKRRTFVAGEKNRVLLSKVLVALIPESHDLIRSALSCERTRYCRELQFSLFCYLDEVQVHSLLAEYKSDVLKLLFDYLVNVKSNQASAAWMAGDLLGDHWELADAIRVAQQASKIVRYPAGKAALAHAASQINRRISSGGKRS